MTGGAEAEVRHNKNNAIKPESMRRLGLKSCNSTLSQKGSVYGEV